MATIRVVQTMVHRAHHGQRIAAYCSYLCCVGPDTSPTLAQHKVLFQCDNSSVVAALQKGSAKDKTVMHLLSCLWFFVAHYDIVLMPEHIAGVDNCTADHLSRNNMYNFFSINPQVSPIPTPVGPLLQQLLDQTGQLLPSGNYFFLLSKRPSSLHSETLPCWSTEIHPLLLSTLPYCTSNNRVHPALICIKSSQAQHYAFYYKSLHLCHSQPPCNVRTTSSLC